MRNEQEMWWLVGNGNVFVLALACAEDMIEEVPFFVYHYFANVPCFSCLRYLNL